MLTRSASPSFDGIASTAKEAGGLAAWSDRSGTWAALLAERDATPVRISERCEGGVAALAESGFWVACARPSDDEQQSRVLLFKLSAQLTVEQTFELGRAGRDGRKVALALAKQTLFVAWEDGSVGSPSARLGSLSLASAKGAQPQLEAQSLSRPGMNGREPSLIAHAGAVYASWSESELTAQGERHRVLVARLGEPARKLRDVRVAQPAPVLTADAEGLVLGFRDAPSSDTKPELYIARLQSDLSFAGKPRRMGRANGEGSPTLALCEGTRAAVTPLEHAGELYVAFHPLSAALQAVEDNHQYYANKREFVLASAFCDARHVTALLAERSAPSKPGVQLLKVGFRCAE